MKNKLDFPGFYLRVIMVLVLLGGCPVMANAQDRLKDIPGYAEYLEMTPLMRAAVKQGSLQVLWKADSKTFEYGWDGQRFSFEVKKLKASVLDPTSKGGQPVVQGGPAIGQQARDEPKSGRQHPTALSPDGKLKAPYRDRHLFLGGADSSLMTAITADGTDRNRIKYGTASWVYGEEGPISPSSTFACRA